MFKLLYLAQHTLNQVRLQKIAFFAKIRAVNYFCKKLHLRCLTGFWIRLCFKANEISSKWNMPFIYQSPLSCRVSCLTLKNFQKNFRLNLIDLPNCALAPRRKVASFPISFWMISCLSTSVLYSNNILSVLFVSDSVLSCSEIEPLHPLKTEGRNSSW